jgi:paraquat-inducible protein A
MAFRVFHLAQEWAMIEVLMLGILVALVKLHHLAHVVPGVALWTFGAFTVLLTATTTMFDSHELWAKLEAAS